MTSIRDRAQSLAATGLSGTARVLRGGAEALGGFAALLRPGALEDERPPRPADEDADSLRDASSGVGEAADAALDALREAGAEATDALRDAGGVAAAGLGEVAARTRDAIGEADGDDDAASDDGDRPPPAEAPGEVTRARSAPSHVAELARGTVAQISRELDGLSTDELRLLLEHETTHRNRRGVLDAVEQALTS